jgi:FlaA1/EpsC-like NDP-sugar epimerase
VLQPEQLVILDQCEFNLYQIRIELEEKYPALQFSLHLVDVKDAVAINEIMQRYHFDMLFHAAAYKHVPMLEFQTRTAISNNVLGTFCLAESALKHHIKKFILVSTDKAVNPTNVMGATKRAAEILCQYFNENATTKFITVRFGNVLGSAGSVVPRFAEQIKNGGPVTVTHPDMTRYFMTIPEATQLILQATSMGNGGEIFVLDMGEPIKIKYLAEQMIILAGLQIGKDIEIKYIGLRPGEKLFEELFYDDEHLAKTTHNKIFRSNNNVNYHAIPEFIEQIKQLCDANNENALRDCLKTFVPEYNPHYQQQSVHNT